MQYTAPSFLSFRGKRFIASGPKEAGRIISGNSPAAVIFIPGPEALGSPRAWANALSAADYLIVLGNECAGMDRLMEALDRIVFSPVARRLSSALFVQDGDKADELLLSVKGQGYNEILIQEGLNG